MSKSESAEHVSKEMRHEKLADLDTILEEEIGEFGKYQRWALGLSLTVALLAGLSANEFVFTAARITSRCSIPECESNSEFSQWWLHLAIPNVDGSFDNCQRFNSSGVVVGNSTCAAAAFDRDVTVPCEEYVYENTDTVVYEFNLACQEWKRSLIGTVAKLGMFVTLPIAGIIADRFGRRNTLAFFAFNRAWIGLSRSWAQSYTIFVILEFLEAALGAAGFSCAYILAMEFMGPKYRVVAGATMSTLYTLGLIAQSLVAWAIPYWRHLNLALYIPQLCTIIYFWIMPESVRWYLSKGLYTKADEQLKEAARVNGKKLSEKSLENLREHYEREKRNNIMLKETQRVKPWLVTLVFQHKPIMIRCIIAPVWWVSAVLAYHGLSMNAVNMSGNKYLNYMVVAAVEIPGFWTAVLLFDRIGRKPLLLCGFWICAACQIGFIFIPEGYYVLSLTVYIIGKYSISMVINSLYIYTSEIFPTCYRASLFAFCSFIGRIGSILAPLTPALASLIWSHLPYVMFGGFAALSGFLMLLAVETKGTTLPDTMHEAAELGSRRKK